MRASSSRSMCLLAGLLVVGSLHAAVEASRLIHAQAPAVAADALQVQRGAQQQGQQQQQQQTDAVAPSHRKMLQFNSRWIPTYSGFWGGASKSTAFFGAGVGVGVSTAPLARTRDTSDQPDDQQPQQGVFGLPIFSISRLTAGAAVQFGGLVQVGAEVPDDRELADAFYLTNRLRSQHGVPSLTWNKEYAEDVAKIAGACGGKPQVRDDVEDNIAWGYATFGAAVQAWYDENRRYSYDATSVPPGTDHFVRMVWKDAKQMGCAYSFTCRVYICRYSPVHVSKGKLSEQVPPPQMDVSSTNSG